MYDNAVLAPKSAFLGGTTLMTTQKSLAKELLAFGDELFNRYPSVLCRLRRLSLRLANLHLQANRFCQATAG
eukprot:scaffold225_cov388-Prasinococcus_capsulatus_cf.AAC.23